MTITYLGYRLAAWVSTSLPEPLAWGCAERLSDAQWRCSTTDRRAVQANLAMVLGGAIPEDSPLVREVFRNFGRYLVELFAMHRAPQPAVRVHGAEHLADARRGGRGAIVLTAHLGHWELGAVILKRLGLPMAAVALPHEDPRMDRWFNALRARCGIRVIPQGPAAVQRSLQALRGGEMLGVLGDLDFSGNGTRVSFCQREVVMPRGPATLSVRARVPVVPAFLLREGRSAFQLCLEPSIWPTRVASTEESIQQLTQRYAAVIERYVTRYPTQWLVFQPLETARSE